MPRGAQRQKTVSNRLLRMLPADELERLLPHLEHVDLRLKETIPASRLGSHVYFVESGVVSMICLMEDGARIEVGMVGYEGMVGLPLLFDSGVSNREAMVQIEGHAFRLQTTQFRSALTDLPALLPLLMRYAGYVLLEISQSAACNGRHPIEQRLARWLLTTHDRIDGDSFTMTQEIMSTLLGVRRPGVTLALGALQKAGLVSHAGGNMRILNRSGLQSAACECYGIIKRGSRWMVK